MTCNAMPDDRQLGLAPLDEKVDHVRGLSAGRVLNRMGSSGPGNVGDGICCEVPRG